MSVLAVISQRDVYSDVHADPFQIRDSERKPTSWSLLLCAVYAAVTVLLDNVWFHLAV